jgi:hypothetical protein
MKNDCGVEKHGIGFGGFYDGKRPGFGHGVIPNDHVSIVGVGRYVCGGRKDGSPVGSGSCMLLEGAAGGLELIHVGTWTSSCS